MIIEVELDNPGESVCLYPPTPQNSLFFYINDQVSMQREQTSSFVLQPRSVIVGPQLTPVRLDIKKSHKAIRVGFHPGGLYRLLGIPMNEIQDDSLDAAEIFGNEMQSLQNQFLEAGDFDEIKNIIEQFLLSKHKSLQRAIPFDKAMLELLRLDGHISIEQVASQACLSLRQFERVCRERIGMPPKLFARLARFSKAYRLRENSAQLSWTHIAHACNYFDQAHLIRDFREFTLMAPGVIEKALAVTPIRLQAALKL